MPFISFKTWSTVFLYQFLPSIPFNPISLSLLPAFSICFIVAWSLEELTLEFTRFNISLNSFNNSFSFSGVVLILYITSNGSGVIEVSIFFLPVSMSMNISSDVLNPKPDNAFLNASKNLPILLNTFPTIPAGGLVSA